MKSTMAATVRSFRPMDWCAFCRTGHWIGSRCLSSGSEGAHNRVCPGPSLLRRRGAVDLRLRLLRHQPLASQGFLHARAAGLMVLGVLVDVPDVVDALARQDVLR